MNIPKSIKINGVDYAVKLVSGLNDGESVLYGIFDENDMEIRINTNNQTHAGQCRTLLHEMIHAILYENDVKNLGYDCRTPKSEEELCEMFSRSLYQIIAENKSMFTE